MVLSVIFSTLLDQSLQHSHTTEGTLRIDTQVQYSNLIHSIHISAILLTEINSQTTESTPRLQNQLPD